MFGRKKKIQLRLSDADYRMIRDCLLEWRNKLIAEGHYTDAIDEVLPLFMA